MRDAPQIIPIGDAIDLIGSAYFGADWIGSMTEKELATLKELGPKHDHGTIETIEPCPPNRRQSLERAMGRYGRMNAQRNTALDKIHLHQLVFNDYSRCERAKCVRAAAEIRGNRNSTTPNAKGDLRGRPATAQAEVITAMIADLQANRITPKALQDAKRDLLAAQYNRAAGTCVKARKVALDEWETRSRARK